MPADHPYAELNERREQAAHHAEQARKWADAADREENAPREPGPDGTVHHRSAQARGQRYAAISTAHALAALATAAGGGGILSIEDLGR